MTKLLKGLVFVLLLLGIAALTLGTLLFKKREILVGRTQKLETAIMAIATTIEEKAADVESQPAFPERDTSDVTAETVDNPRKSEFWAKYAYDLEMHPNAAHLDLRGREQELASYYKIDPVTGGPARDGQGRRVTSGPGTMQGVLDTVLGKSEEQLNRLNATRQQLTDLRKEFVSTVEEYNQLKQGQRRTLKECDDLKQQIVQLKGEIEPLKQDIAVLKEEKRSLEDTIVEQRRDVARLQEDNTEKAATIDLLNEQIRKFDVTAKQAPAAGASAATAPVGSEPGRTFQGNVAPGRKGSVVAVNREWNFAILDLSEQFMAELLSDSAAGIPRVELMVKRPGPTDVFVAKVRLIQVRQDEKLGICDILTDWLQAPVETGDVVFF